MVVLIGNPWSNSGVKLSLLVLMKTLGLNVTEMLQLAVELKRREGIFPELGKSSGWWYVCLPVLL